MTQPLFPTVPARPANLPVSDWSEAAVRVLNERYAAKDAHGRLLETPDDIFWRVAWTIAEAERKFGGDDEAVWAVTRRFYHAMVSREFMPNSPTIANAGKGNGLQYSACYVLPIEDSLSGIFTTLHNSALIFQSGGGVGYAFSRLRPQHSRVRTTSGVSSGPLSFLRIYNAASEYVKQGGMRRGASMSILRVDHPDIEAFIDCKRAGGITNFNISVAITDAFIQALELGEDYALLAQPGWPLPDGSQAQGGERLGTRNARDMWRNICEAAWATGDPGLFFIDRVNRSRANAVPGLQTIDATNPCGEQALPPFAVCTLGHLNLARFVTDGVIDYDRLRTAVATGIRFLDNVVEVNPYPLPEIREQALNERRIGLGVMGWADLLFLLGIPYASEAAVDLATTLGRFLYDEAVHASETLAERRGPFPWFSQSIYQDLPPRRNSNVTTVAPTGTCSIFAHCASGIEPIFALAFQHRVKHPDGERVLTFVNQQVQQALASRGLMTPEILEAVKAHGSLKNIPAVPDDVKQLYATAHEIDVDWHIRHQAAWQQAWSDSCVSKTINLPHDATVDDVERAYRLAWETGCLGTTVFRDGCKGDQVLHAGTDKPTTPAATPTTPAPEPAMIEPRPLALPGTTYRLQTPLGTAFITVTTLPNGEPLEVFVRVGKAGSDTEAFAEALGRLISTMLRFNRLPDRRARAEELAAQLARIGGVHSIGFGAGRIRSVPDAIAKALTLALEATAPPTTMAPPDITPSDDHHASDGHHPMGDLCPDCGEAAVVYLEGCRKCLALGCGFTEC